VNFGPYQVLGELGRGGMGIVFRGRAPDGRDVAVKVLINQAKTDALARFDRERRMVSAFTEAEGFVPLLDAGSAPQGPFLVMPFVTGGTLRDRMKRGPMPIDDCVAIVLALSRAVARAHERGIVHRDLKPENVLFSGDGQPLVTDLGLAKHFRKDVDGASQSVSLSREGGFVGTVGYMAPEQMGSAKDVGPPADVFALGAILYECLAGEPAFSGDSVHEVVAKIVSATRPPVVSNLRKDTPRWLSHVVGRALERDLPARYPDAAALAHALEAGPSGAPPPSRTPLVALLTVVALAAGGVAFAATRGKGEASPPAPTPVPVVTTHATAPTPAPRTRKPGEPPEWFAALPKDDRPPFPLPFGVTIGEKPGEYLYAKDDSVLVFVPAGSFNMGWEGGAWSRDERVVHEVVLSAYFIGKYEVTVDQFRAFVAATAHKTVAESGGSGLCRMRGEGQKEGTEGPVDGANWRRPFLERDVEAQGNQPVSQVGWQDTQAYCRWAGLRLPTEAEWEKACGWDPKARKSHRLPWGVDYAKEPFEFFKAGTPHYANLADIALLKEPLRARIDIFPGYDDGFARTAPVGSFPEGASAYGALDMIGNVQEWVQDNFIDHFYETGPKNDPVASDERSGMRLLRGCSFTSYPRNARASYRLDQPDFYVSEDTGFRIALSAKAR
jgi:formylglycine-generating enzyme required for sulfatase activity